ncbi:Clp protease [Candidatus Saccharibacteria bacterium]|nr:MAG: Clp protease [Candidatus Saccharibacteria bacterium]
MNHTEQLPDLRSARARKARWAVRLHRSWLIAVLLSVAAAVAIMGFVIINIGEPVGWMVLGLAAWPFMAGIWVSWELGALHPDPTSDHLTDRIDAPLLGLLRPKMTPERLSRVAMQLPGGRFFVLRFGFGMEFLPSLVSRSPEDMQAVWQEAEHVRRLAHADRIDASVVAVALVRTIPHVESHLAKLRLSLDDVVVGARWYHHILKLVRAEEHRSKTQGGIGRDWSFGFSPLLGQFGTSISEQVMYGGLMHRELEAHQELHGRMMQLLVQGGRRNAVLVGPLGAGKTTVVQALAKKLMEAGNDVPPQLKYRQVIGLDASVLISRAKGRGDLEMLVQRLCAEAISAKNVILFMDEAQLFFMDGPGSVDLSNILLPVLDGGALQIILAMDETHWQRISLQNTALAQYMNRLMVIPTDKESTMLVLQDQLLVIEYRQKVLYTHQALETAYDLSSRYMNDLAMPGKALKLLESAANYAEQNMVTSRSVQAAIEQTQGVKVGTADTAQERQTLLNLEDIIHQRMINQSRAVSVVSDALRRARAGVRNTQRPIGTFLFLGPTGVGKTELAKSLAAAYFGGTDHMVRIDLNEYVRPEDVSRLIADAASDPNSLTAQISRKPFSVVLMDEIEKAHDTVLSTLLQMLDEGILRDVNNREVSFRDAIVIATSNAGADKIRQHIEAGEQLEQFEQSFNDELINDNVFRPEFLNRFDEIVLFRPLEEPELMQIIDLILQDLNKNLANQKITVQVDDDAKQLLVAAGYDPRLGARPLRRIVQRVVESLVAKQLLGGQVAPGGSVVLSVADVQDMLGQRGV